MSPTRVLVHIGYHKTGTNWLQHEWWNDPETGYTWSGRRRDHPVRRIVSDRALEFDAAARRRDFEPFLQEAERKGLLPVVSLERLSGHPFSGGHDSRQIADRLRGVFPEGRVLMVVRDQRTIILSTYKQYVKAGGAGTLEQFVDPPRTASSIIPWFDFRHFEYEHLIRHYNSLFGADNVLAMPYEQLVSDGRRFVEKIAEFAGRPVPESKLERLPYTRRSNRAPSALTIETIRRLNRFHPTELSPIPLVDLRSTGQLADRLKKSDALSRPLTRGLIARREARLRSTVEELVGDRYAASNRATAELIGVDLAAYGWNL